MCNMKKLIFSFLVFLLAALPVQASLWEYFDGNLPSLTERGQVAYNLGIVNHLSDYVGSYAQNTALESALAGYPMGMSDLYQSQMFGGSAGIPITDYGTTLSAPLTSSATTIYVASVTTTDGHVITTADISPAIYLVLDADSDTKKEIVKCTAISGTSFTGCTRGLAFYGDEAEVAANKKTHSAGSAIILSDVHLLFVSLNAAQTWTRIQTYSVYPESGVGADATTTNQFITFGQVNNIANQGAATSTESVAGIGQIGTQSEMASTTFDSLAPTFLSTKYSTSSPDVRGLYIPVAENDGYLNQDWLDLSEDYTFTGDVYAGVDSYTANTAGYLTGGTSALGTFAVWAAITDGSFRIIVDGTAYNVDAIDFSGDGSMADVATTIQSALQTATSESETVAWSTDHFVITSTTLDEDSEISVLETSTGTVGTDISGAGAADYMDCDTGNGTATQGTSDHDKLVKLDVNGQLTGHWATTTPTDDNQFTSKAYVDDEIANIPTYKIIASDLLFVSAHTWRLTTNTSYVKVKEIELDVAGEYRIKFDLKVQTGSGTAYGRIYKNGVAFGTEQTESTTNFVTYSEDLTFAADDLVQLYIKHSSGMDSSNIQNFRFYATVVPLSTVITD